MGLTSEQYKIAESNGISRQLAFHRYEDLFWDAEKAITKVPRTRDKKNQEFLKWKEVALANGFTYLGYYTRVRNGMSPEMAATTPKQDVGPKKRHDKEFFVYKGETFICQGTIKECAEMMGIKETTFRFYLTPSYKRLIEKRKSTDNCIKVYSVEDDEDGTNESCL